MKQKIIYILLLIGMFSCTKSSFECQFSGEKIRVTENLNHFNSIEVNPMIYLTIVQGTASKIEIRTDKDVIKNIDFTIKNDKLILTNHTDCLIENSDADAYITVTTPHLEKIIANTERLIKSGNTWYFNNLTIICENYNEGSNNVADFDIDIDNDALTIVADGSSIFNISGRCNQLNVGFYGSGPSFNGADLHAQNIHVYQRSQADMHLYPIAQITGDLYGYGDIYLHHRPPIINIVEHYSGHIYFVN